MATDPLRVLIVGCGPSGAAAAATLAKAGAEVRVLDRASFPRDKICGDALSNEAVDILHQLGAGEEVLSGPHAVVRRARALFPDGHHVGRSYDPPGIIVPRMRLDAALARAATRAGAELLEGHAVRELISEGSQVVGARGKDFEYRADVVIAADGHGSLARSVLDHPKPQGRYLGVARRVYLSGVRFDSGLDVADHYFELDLPFGYGWVFPDVEGRANVGVYQRGDHFVAGPKALDEALSRFIANHPERFGDAEELMPRKSWPLPLAPAPWALSAPGLVAVGDAGNHIDPLSGEGIWQALRSGQLAAEAILAKGPENFAAAYAQGCEQEIAVPSRRREKVQRALHHFVRARLYRLPPARWVLGWGYGRQSLEVTKSL
jgi:geranylgeranyl reductase family protein